MKVSINPPILTPNRGEKEKLFIQECTPDRRPGDRITVR